MPSIRQNDTTIDWMKYAVIVAGGLTILLGCIVLIGWYTQSTLLVQLRPEFVPMQYNTALVFILCGMGLVALVCEHPRLLLLCGGLSAGLAFLTLLQYILGFDLGIDQLFLEPAITVKTAHPGRMAPITAFSHLIYSVGLVLASRIAGSKWHDLLSGLLGTIITAVGLGILFGYLLGRGTPYDWSHLTYMAVPTALGFTILGAGLLVFAIRAGAVKEQWPNWLPVAVGIGVATLAIVLWQALLAHERLTNAQAMASQAAHLKSEIETDVTNQILALERMARRWEQQGGTPKALWAADAARYMQHHPGYQAIEWVDASFHVRWIEPLKGNEVAQGLDIVSRHRRWQSFIEAAQQRGAAVSRSIDLILGGKGFLVYVPLHIGKDKRFDGFMVGVFRIQSLLKPVLSEAVSKGYELELYDGDEQIYSNNNKKSNPPDGSSRIQEQTIEIYNINWRLRLWPDQGLLAALHSPLPAISLVVGLTLAGLLTLTMWLNQTSRGRANALATLNRELTSEITERQLVEERLRASQGMLETVFDNAPFMIWGTDEKGILKYFNKKSVETMGFSPEEAIGMPNMNLHPPDKRDEVFEKFKVHVGEKLEDKLELPLMTKSGKRLIGSMAQAIYEDEYGKKWYFGFIEDITERKRIEKALQESEAWMRGIFNSIEEGVLVVTPDRKFADINPACEVILGYTSQELVNQSTEIAHVDHDHYVEFGKQIMSAFDKDESARFEFRVKRKNGEVFPAEHTVSLIKDAQGKAIGIVSSIRDITERKRVEKELSLHREHLEDLVTARTGELQQEIIEHQHAQKNLRAQTQRNELILDTMQDGFWIVDLDGKLREVNETYCQMLGYTREQLLSMSIADVEACESPEEVQLHIQKIMTQGWDRFETRHWRQDGTLIDLDVSASLAGVNGERFFFTFFRDITLRKQMELVLQENEQYLRAMFDNMQEGVITTDENGMIESANRVALEMFNYEREQLLGQNVLVLMRAEDRDVHVQQMERYCKQENVSDLRSVVGIGPREVIAMRSDGSEFSMSIAIGEMRVAGQRKFISIIRDISESKKAQQELQNSRQQLRELAGHLQTVREDERAKIARDVHDELGQVLTVLNIDADWLYRHIPVERVALRQKVESMLPIIASAIDSVQRITSELRPAMLDELGLGSAVQWYMEQFQQRTEINCQSSVELNDIPLDSAHAITVFRILQEALTNVARHANATHVTLVLKGESDRFDMQLLDDGDGISQAEISAGDSFGLLGMRERAQTLGGNVVIEGRAGTGTTVTLHLPLNN